MLTLIFKEETTDGEPKKDSAATIVNSVKTHPSVSQQSGLLKVHKFKYILPKLYNIYTDIYFVN